MAGQPRLPFLGRFFGPRSRQVEGVTPHFIMRADERERDQAGLDSKDSDQTDEMMHFKSARLSVPIRGIRGQLFRRI